MFCFQGLDMATLARDHQLLSWLGANSYRTSHYPYAEEDLLMADREGLLVIAECAAVSLDGFSSELLGEYKDRTIRKRKNKRTYKHTTLHITEDSFPVPAVTSITHYNIII